MNKESKLVSVIIPTYSEPRFLEQTIQSVINQTYENIEIIIVDDNGNGTDCQKKVANIILKFKTHDNINYIIHEKNKNGSAARNTGLKVAKGSYIAFLDDDDSFLPSKIELQVDILTKNENSNYAGSYCNYQLLYRNKVYKQYKNKSKGNLAEELLLGKNSICGGSTLLLKREVFSNIGLFDESFIRHQDWEFLMRYFRKYKLEIVPDILVNLNMDGRIDSKSSIICNKIVDIKKHFIEVFKKDIDILEKKNDIYKFQWFSTALFLIQNKKYSIGFEQIKNSSNYTPLNIKDYLSIIFNIIESIIPIKVLIFKMQYVFGKK